MRLANLKMAQSVGRGKEEGGKEKSLDQTKQEEEQTTKKDKKQQEQIKNKK